MAALKFVMRNKRFFHEAQVGGQPWAGLEAQQRHLSSQSLLCPVTPASLLLSPQLPNITSTVAAPLTPQGHKIQARSHRLAHMPSVV